MGLLQNKWICFVKGFLEIKLKGDYLERFFNMCRMHEIYLWNIKRENDICTCNLYTEDLFKLSPLLKKTHTRLKILNRCGIPFYFPLLRKRIIFFIGIVSCLVMLNLMTNYVWAIEYVGNLQISDDELTDFLSQEKIHYGMKKSEINCEENEKKLRAAFSNITWTSIYFDGTKLFIEIKENEKTEPKPKIISGTDIVSTDEGTITSIITRNGIPKVKIGDKVEKGQILVEGSVPVFDEAQNIIDYQIYDADADIMISAIINYEDFIKRSYPVINYAENTKKVNFIDILGYHIEEVFLADLFEKDKDKSFESITEKHQVVVLDNIYLPIYYGEISRKEYYLQYLAYTQKEMENKLQDNLEKFILSLHEKGVQIIEKNVKIVQNKEGMEMKGNILVIKPTGKTTDIIDKSMNEKLEEKAEE